MNDKGARKNGHPGHHEPLNPRKLVEIRAVDILELIEVISEAGRLEQFKEQLSDSRAIVKTTSKNAELIKTFVAADTKLSGGRLKEVVEARGSYQWPHIAKNHQWPHIT